jgi:4-amino-4-deoxy-L-arabinose transferase-like glycosyltransferase
MGAGLAALAALIGQSLGLSTRAAFLVGFLWALHPGLIVFDCVLLTESLFDAVALTGLFLSCRAHSARGLIAAGLLLGLATLVRPLGVLYIPAALALAWPQIHSKVLAISIIVIASFLPPTMWAFRNQAVNEGFRVTTVGDLNLLYYTAAYSISEERHEDWLESWPTRVDGLTNRLSRRLRPGEDVVSAARRLAWDQIRQRPKGVIKVQAKSWLKLFVDHSIPTLAEALGIAYKPSGIFSNLVMNSEPRPQAPPGNSLVTPVLALAWMGLNVLFLVGAIIGANRAIHQRDWRILIFGVATIILFILATGSVGLERFRLPMMLSLFVLAAVALAPRVIQPLRQPDSQS